MRTRRGVLEERRRAVLEEERVGLLAAVVRGDDTSMEWWTEEACRSLARYREALAIVEQEEQGQGQGRPTPEPEEPFF